MLRLIALVSLLAFGCKHGEGSQVSGQLGGELPALNYPTGPEPSMTPGALCTKPDEMRYAEQIPYCNRDVSKEKKDKIFAAYELKFGFTVENLGRENFKIDHFIPLCMGGANEIANLWPQYKTLYSQTDTIEFRLCQLMEEGLMTQVEAIQMMREVKLDVSKAEAMKNSLHIRFPEKKKSPSPAHQDDSE